ncbi:hypothetical protein MOP88_13445 [Sphingomonas sp. WKB10]|nr:hypothetical protein [Sphingomonas sp. WKB10]
MHRDLLLGLLTAILVVVAMAAAAPVFRTTPSSRRSAVAATADALAAGIFLGAGLIHMLPDSAQGYWTYGASYPWPFVICGATIMGLALLERLAWGAAGPLPPHSPPPSPSPPTVSWPARRWVRPRVRPPFWCCF